MLQRHVQGLLNYITHPVSNGVAEAMNSIIQVLKSAARGFRSFKHYRVAILFHCGKLDLLPKLNRKPLTDDHALRARLQAASGSVAGC